MNFDKLAPGQGMFSDEVLSTILLLEELRVVFLEELYSCDFFSRPASATNPTSIVVTKNVNKQNKVDNCIRNWPAIVRLHPECNGNWLQRAEDTVIPRGHLILKFQRARFFHIFL